jgi:hypothetical protein
LIPARSRCIDQKICEFLQVSWAGLTSVNWFRSNIRHGSRLALLALAIQFGLAFGHHHGALARATSSHITAYASEQSPAGHDSGELSSDLCAICAVVALAKSGLSAKPPVLPTPDSVAFAYQTTEAQLFEAPFGRAAFQPRAPPAS